MSILGPSMSKYGFSVKSCKNVIFAMWTLKNRFFGYLEKGPQKGSQELRFGHLDFGMT